MAALEVLALDEATPQIRAPGASDTYLMPRNMELTTTWNNGATTFTGVKVSVTDTASAAASLLMDLQVGGVSQFSIGKTGEIRSAKGYSKADVLIGPADGTGFAWSGVNAYLSAGGVSRFAFTETALVAGNGIPFGWLAAEADAAAPDLCLYRDAANILAQRNGVNAQASRLYFSFTDASNYTRLALKTATGVHTIEAESAGTGEADIDLALTPKGTGRVRFGTNTASADVAISGYIEVKDSGGTVRKLATIT